MIIEWIQSKLISASQAARAVGFVNSSIALQARYKRCAKAWQSHLEHCRQVIIEQLPLGAKRILILGSGPLLEIPIDELLKRGLKIVLVDMVHPTKTRKFAALHRDQVELVEADVTGIVDAIKNSEAIRNFQFRPSKELRDQLGHFDFVVSANLISQLALDPYEVIKKNHWADDAFFGRLAKRMGDQHLDWLKTFDAKTLVIGDVERTYYDKGGQEIEKSDSAYRLISGELIAKWDWEISPLGETSKEFCYIMSVESRIL